MKDHHRRDTDRLVDTLLRTAQNTNTTLPAGLDLESLVNARFAGTPAEQFRKRLEATRVTGWAEQKEAIRDLAPQLTPGLVWATLVAFDPKARLAPSLVEVGAPVRAARHRDRRP